MSTNFEFLEKNWPMLHDIAEQAEDYIYTDPQSSLAKMRLLVEKYTDIIAVSSNVDFEPRTNLNNKLKVLKYYRILDNSDVISLFHDIKNTGNSAVHDFYDDSEEALINLKKTFVLSKWVCNYYGNFPSNSNKKFINPIKIINAKPKEIDTLAEKEFEESLLELKNQSSRLSKTDLDEKIKSIREKSHDFFFNADLSEADTRILFIDPKLREAGWIADSINLNWALGTRPEEGKNIAIAEVPVENGKADYMLFIGLEPVAIVEAKK